MVAQPSAAPEAGVKTLTVSQLDDLVVQYNATVQEKFLDYAISQGKFRAEYGIFEPEAYATGTHQADLRQNSTEQAAGANGISVLRDANNLYEAGVEALLPTGTQIKAGYNLSELNNNIPPSLFSAAILGSQYETFAGLSVTQPLLKNFGTRATMAEIRLAALSNKIAYQEYRRELMTAVGSAEAAYWNLYFAREQVRFYEDSVKTSQRILSDNQALLDAGKGSQLEVMEAQAAVGLRQAKLDDARQKAKEAGNRLLSLYGQTVGGSAVRVLPADTPKLEAITSDPEALRAEASELSPDYLIQVEKSQQQLVRLGYARNQRLIELNAKGAYGLNGLADSPWRSTDTMTHAGFPSWSFGLELKIPLFGGIKGRNELAAARLQVTQAQVAIQAMQTEIANGIDTARDKAERARASAQSFQTVVSYNDRLLDSALVSLHAGKLESRKVLEIESDRFNAQNSVLEALVRYKIAQIELGLLVGSTLKDHGLEVSQAQLQDVTRKLARTRKWNQDAYQRALDRVHALYNPPAASQSGPAKS